MTNGCGICFKVHRTRMPEHTVNQVPAWKHGKGNLHHSKTKDDEKSFPNLKQPAVFIEFVFSHVARFDCLGVSAQSIHSNLPGSMNVVLCFQRRGPQGKNNPILTFFRMILIVLRLRLRLAGAANKMHLGAMNFHHRDAAYHQAEKPRRLESNRHSLPWSSRSSNSGSVPLKILG